MDRFIFPQDRNRQIYDWLLLILLGVVVVIKFNDIFLPFFWDELGVYGHGVAYQYTHKLSLMPGSVPSDTSRGHPLMFTFINATVWKMFGDSLLVTHGFALFVSLCLVTIIYWKVSIHVSPLAGIVAVTFLCMQPLFLAQSSLVLPEIMLTLFALLSLTSYFERKYFQFAFFASLGILTKESAIVIPATCIAFSLLQSILYKKIPGALKIRNLLLTLIPYAVFGIFLLIQKVQNGWYFFPYHLESVKIDYDGFTSQFSAFFNSVFWSQGRYWSEKLLLASLVICLLKNQLFNSNFGKSFLTLIGIFMLSFLCFSSFSAFYMDRYVLAVLTGACILVGAALTAITQNKFAVFFITFFLCLIAYEHWDSPTFQYDSDLSYRKPVQTLHEAVSYVQVVARESGTVWCPWPAWYAINYPEGGYLNRMTLKTTFGADRPPSYYIYNSPGDISLPDPQKFNIELLREFKVGFAVTKVYRVQPVKGAGF